MKTEITKENCLDLIDRLASKELTFGCIVAFQLRGQRQLGSVAYLVSDCERPWVGVYYYKTLESKEHVSDLEILGHPILKCNIEQQFFQMKWENIEAWKEALYKLTQLWWNASGGDLTKSLQSILSEAEWETICPKHFPQFEQSGASAFA